MTSTGAIVSGALASLLIALPAVAVDLTGGNFKCYKVEQVGPGIQPPRNVIFNFPDFSTLFGSVVEPAELCNPVDKNGEGMNNTAGAPYGHLLCYKLRTPGNDPLGLIAHVDQFGFDVMRVNDTVAFCQPALKNREGCNDRFGTWDGRCDVYALERELNHFQCHRARRVEVPATKIVPLVLEDQFGLSKALLDPPNLFCPPMPVKNFERLPVPDPEGNLKCYPFAAVTPTPPQDVIVEDQFWSLRLRTGRPTRLCERAIRIPMKGKELPPLR